MALLQQAEQKAWPGPHRQEWQRPEAGFLRTLGMGSAPVGLLVGLPAVPGVTQDGRRCGVLIPSDDLVSFTCRSCFVQIAGKCDGLGSRVLSALTSHHRAVFAAGTPSLVFHSRGHPKEPQQEEFFLSCPHTSHSEKIPNTRQK